MKAMQEYGLREPEFIDMEVAFRINLYRGQNEVKNRDHDMDVPDNVNKVPDNTDKVPNTTWKLPDSVSKMPDMTAELLGVKHRRARAVLMNMVEDAYLRKEGAARSTIYVKQ